MRRLLILILAGLVFLVPVAIAAEPEDAELPTITGQELADALSEWDGYDFQDAGDTWPGALRSGPSASADPSDPYGADGTILVLPPLEDPAHVVVSVRLSSAATPGVWDHYQRTMDELGFAEEDKLAVYAALGQMLGLAFANADEDEQTHVTSVSVDPYQVLWQAQTSGFEATDPAAPVAAFPVPDGGVTLEIVPPNETSVVIPMPDPTPTPTPDPTPRRTPRPTAKPTAKATARPAQAPAPSDWVCDGVSSAISDPLDKRWSIKRLDWSNKGSYDRIIVTLDQTGSGGDGTQAIVHELAMEDVESEIKVSAPSEGQTAIALGLFQDVRLNWSLDRAMTMPAVDWLTMEKDNNGFPWVVLGVDDDACYSLQVPVWTADDPKSRQSVQVTVDVQH